MRIDKLTIKAREALVAAQELASRRGHAEIFPEHMLYALCEQEGGLVPPLLRKVGVDPARILTGLKQALDRLPSAQGGIEVGLSRKGRELIERAEREAERFKDEYTSTEHVLLALTDGDFGMASRLLKEAGIDHASLLQALTEVRGTQRVTDENPEGKYQALEKFTRDLTDVARKGKLDPVIGRDEEIRRAIQVLSRRTKNNPVLIGEPGVGKTAIVEGIAQRIVDRRRARVAQGQAHPRARSRRRSWPAPSTAASSRTGSRRCCKEIEAAARAVILFIDELHTLVGAGAAEGAQDARTCSSRRSPAASCAASAPPRSTSIASTSRRTRRSSGASSRCSWASRASPTPWRSCAASRRSTRSTTASEDPRRGARGGGAAVEQPLHHRSLPAGQGHRSHRRGREPAEDGDRLHADGPSTSCSAHRSQLQIEQQALQLRGGGEGRPVEGAPELDRRPRDRRPARSGSSHEGALEVAKRRTWISRMREVKEQIDKAKTEAELAQRRGDLELRPPSCATASCRDLESSRQGGSQADRRQAQDRTGGDLPPRGGDRGGHGPHRRQVDRHPRREDARGGAGAPANRMEETAAASASSARTRPSRRWRTPCAAAEAGLQDPNRPIGSLPLPRPHGRGQDRARRALAEFLFDDETHMVRST